MNDYLSAVAGRLDDGVSEGEEGRLEEERVSDSV